jgi:hypothetical protein
MLVIARSTILRVLRVSIENVRKKGIAPSCHVSNPDTSGSDEKVRKTDFVSFVSQRNCVDLMIKGTSTSGKVVANTSKGTFHLKGFS